MSSTGRLLRVNLLLKDNRCFGRLHLRDTAQLNEWEWNRWNKKSMVAGSQCKSVVGRPRAEAAATASTSDPVVAGTAAGAGSQSAAVTVEAVAGVIARAQGVEAAAIAGASRQVAGAVAVEAPAGAEWEVEAGDHPHAEMGCGAVTARPARTAVAAADLLTIRLEAAPAQAATPMYMHMRMGDHLLGALPNLLSTWRSASGDHHQAICEAPLRAWRGQRRPRGL
mmetsp:Transcript_35137/g.67151  ORF Transcript_35137/g.67151 Transcript_35137/m.67151 type:complete len:224 (-) Transcript_35137:397-1068(-)